MRFYHQRQLDRFQRSIDFVQKNTKDFASGARTLDVTEQLKEVTEKLQTSPQKKSSPRVVSSSGKLGALNALREELGQIARTARAIAAQDSSFNNTFILPDKRRKEELAKAAAQFITDAQANKEAFFGFEMQPDFIEKLQGKLEAYQQIQAAPAQARPAVATPLSETSEDVQKGIALVETLSVLLENKYRDDKAKLALWKSASGVDIIERKKRKNKASE